MQHLVQSIGTVSSPYTQKFGIPRQPQLVEQARICITLNAEFSADCVRGLDGFEYIWVQFLFHDALQEGWSEMVRPPRLGGKRKWACLPREARTGRTIWVCRCCH